jgi:hypothetical protein
VTPAHCIRDGRSCGMQANTFSITVITFYGTEVSVQVFEFLYCREYTMYSLSCKLCLVPGFGNSNHC